jgi:hypothetical protein
MYLVPRTVDPVTHFVYDGEMPCDTAELWIGKQFIAKSKEGTLEFFNDNPILPINLIKSQDLFLKWPEGQTAAWGTVTANTIECVITSNVANVTGNVTIIESYESGAIDVPVTNSDGKKNTLVFVGGICGLKSWDWE